MEFVQIDWIAIPNSSFQWSIIEEGLVCFSSLLLFMTSVVERSMSVEFLDDTKMERAAKTLGDKVRIQNYADRLKKCSSKSRMDCHWAKRREVYLGRKTTFIIIKRFCGFGSSLKNYMELIVNHGLNISH